MPISPRELERILLSAYWGDPGAERFFALLLTTGFVVQADSTRAAEFFMRAVEHGYAENHLAATTICERGNCVLSDPAEMARRWIAQAGVTPEDPPS